MMPLEGTPGRHQTVVGDHAHAFIGRGRIRCSPSCRNAAITDTPVSCWLDIHVERNLVDVTDAAQIRNLPDARPFFRPIGIALRIPKT
jgi:hypothetical protein